MRATARAIVVATMVDAGLVALNASSGMQYLDLRPI